MKSLLQFLFRRRLTRHPDSFALTRTALWNSIARSIQLQQSQNKSVWMIAHFLDTFTECQEMLESNGIEYIVDTEQVSEQWFHEYSKSAEQQVRLMLADMTKPIFSDPEQYDGASLRIAVMVVERHPFGPKDDLLTEFASSLPAKVELGYFLSLDDEIVKRMVPPQMIDLLRAMGLQDQDLISSSMLTKRLKKLIERGSRDGDSNVVAESASQWFALQDSGDS